MYFVCRTLSPTSRQGSGRTVERAPSDCQRATKRRTTHTAGWPITPLRSPRGLGTN